MGFKKYILIVSLLLLTVTAAEAQSISASAPAHVATGENFRLSYTVNSQDVEGFRAASIPAGLEVVAGPYTSSQSNFQIINGHTSSSKTITYTYTIYAEKAGTYTIPAAHATVEGKRIQSNQVKVTVSGSNVPAHSNAPKMHDEDQAYVPAGNELFIKVSANKARVYEQEPVLLTYKVYTTQQLTYLEGNMPDLKGFHTQEMPLPQQKQFHVETLKGRKYNCVTWSQYVLFPQMTGKIEVPAITYKGIVIQPLKSVDPFEAFFNGGSGYREVKKTIVAPAITLQVDPLPKRPDNFSGGVGKFDITTKADQTTVKTGDAFHLYVTVSGTGNLKLLKQPTIQFPTSFDVYDPKTTDQSQLTANGVEGAVIYEFIAIPNTPGKFTIPAVEFTYFDTQIKQYVTKRTNPIDIEVQKGKGKAGAVAQFAEKDKDIRPLKMDDDDKETHFFASSQHFIALFSLTVCFLLLVVILRRRAQLNADLVRTRNKKATRIAHKRLQKAVRLMKTGQSDAFFDEVLRALWAFVSFKLNIPMQDLSRENVAEKLKEQNLNEQLINNYIAAIDECEFMRYAPDDVEGNMKQTLEKALQSIEEIEDNIKTPHRYWFWRNLVLLAICFTTLSLQAKDKQTADSLFMQGNYQQSIAIYEQLLHDFHPSSITSDLYYNLGCAYYRTNDMEHAVEMFDHALKLNPADTDTRFNLQLARSKAGGKYTEESHLFFVTWYQELVYLFSVDTWAVIGTIALLLFFCASLLFLFTYRLLWRRIGFYSAIGMLILFILSHIFAYQQQQQINFEKTHITLQKSTK